ncbi:MAG: hypothetical protein M3342_08250 [Bacteroidota bacterium]|nr:hypothetical protein [Bacteroidota bacterium]
MATTPVEKLERIFGKWGKRLWEKAHSIDDYPRYNHTLSGNRYRMKIRLMKTVIIFLFYVLS